MNKEILWNIINALIAGGLVFLGGVSTGKLTLETLEYSLVAGAIATLVLFRDYWSHEEGEYSTIKLLRFL